MEKNSKELILTRFVDWIYVLVSGLLMFFKYSILFLYYKIIDNEDKNPEYIYPSNVKSKYTIYEKQIKKYKESSLQYVKYLVETPLKLSFVFVIFYLIYHFSLSDIVKLILK